MKFGRDDIHSSGNEHECMNEAIS